MTDGEYSYKVGITRGGANKQAIIDDLLAALECAAEYLRDPQAAEAHADEVTAGNCSAGEAVLERVNAAIAKVKGQAGE